jgi:hypothetical protein
VAFFQRQSNDERPCVKSDISDVKQNLKIILLVLKKKRYKNNFVKETRRGRMWVERGGDSPL